MTPDEIRAIREVCGAAWFAPWRYDHMGAIVWGPAGPLKSGDLHLADLRGYGALERFAGPERAAQQMDATGKFIAAARSDVPALLDEVDRLRGLLGETTNHMPDDIDGVDMTGLKRRIASALGNPGAAEGR